MIKLILLGLKYYCRVRFKKKVFEDGEKLIVLSLDKDYPINSKTCDCDICEGMMTQGEEISIVFKKYP